MAVYTMYAVRVFVTDWDRALTFYRDTLEMGVLFHDRALGWAELDTGACHLALERAGAAEAAPAAPVDADAADPGTADPADADQADPETADLVGRFVGVSLQVDDIHETYRKLRERGVAFEGEPTPQPWGGTLAHLVDPDGNVITLLGR